MICSAGLSAQTFSEALLVDTIKIYDLTLLTVLSSGNYFYSHIFYQLYVILLNFDLNNLSYTL